MKRVLAAGSVFALALSLPAATAVAHPCTCFPPGEWHEAALPPEVMAMSPQAASVVSSGVLVFGRTPGSAELDAVLLTLPGSSDDSPGQPGAIAIDLALAEGANASFVASDPSSNDVLMGGGISSDEVSGSLAPFVQFSADGGRTWTDIDVEGSGLDLVIDGAKHGKDFVVSGATDVDGGFHPAFAVLRGDALDPHEQLGNAEGFAITIASGPGPDTLSVGGVTVNNKGKQRPVVFTVQGDETRRGSLPGPKDSFPTDILSSGNDVIVTTNDGRVLHAATPGAEFRPRKSLTGSSVLPLTAEPDTALMAFSSSGASFSFDGGDTWAGAALDGIADAGTVKATGMTPSGDFFAFSRGGDDLPHLHLASGPGSVMPVDPLADFATMMAGLLVGELISDSNGVPTRQFVDEVTDAMHDTFDARAEGTPVEEGEEGSAQRFAAKFLDRLEAAGGSGMTSDFLFMATSAIEAEYEERTGVRE